MQGIYERPRTKKALREMISQGKRVTLEATSIMGNEYDGPLDRAPDGRYYVVGPNPHTARNWYAQIIKLGDKITVK